MEVLGEVEGVELWVGVGLVGSSGGLARGVGKGGKSCSKS